MTPHIPRISEITPQVEDPGALALDPPFLWAITPQNPPQACRALPSEPAGPTPDRSLPILTGDHRRNKCPRKYDCLL